MILVNQLRHHKVPSTMVHDLSTHQRRQLNVGPDKFVTSIFVNVDPCGDSDSSENI